MNREGRLKTTEIINAIEDESDDGDTSDEESTQENYLQTKESLSKKEDSVSKRGQAGIASSTKHSDTKITKNTPQKEGRSIRKRKADRDEFEAIPSKISCDGSYLNPDERRIFLHSKKELNEGESDTDDLYNPSKIQSPLRNSAKKNLFSLKKAKHEPSLCLIDCIANQKNTDENDKNNAEGLNKSKNKSAKIKSQSLKESSERSELSSVKNDESPRKVRPKSPNGRSEQGSRTPRNNIALDAQLKGLDQSQIENELSPSKKNFKLSPIKKVTRAENKLNANENHYDQSTRSKTLEIDSMNSLTERELKRLNIDCNPSLYQSPSPVRQRRSSCKSNTPQKCENVTERVLKDSENNFTLKNQLSPLKRAQTPTKERSISPSDHCARGSRTPRKNTGDKVNFIRRLDECQIENELSPMKLKNELSPSKKVNRNSHESNLTSENNGQDRKTKTSQKENKSSLTLRELKRLNIDCNPSVYEAPSPARKSRASVKVTTPKKDKNACETGAKRCQNISTEEDVETRDELVKLKCSTPSKKEKLLPMDKEMTPMSPTSQGEKYKPSVMSPLVKQGLTVRTPVSKKKSGRGFLTPSMAKKEHVSKAKPDDDLDTTRKQLHISTVPLSLPCRDSEFDQIKSFLVRKIEHSAGGCMYISGVPGTGKTATVHAVIRSLQQEAHDGDLPEFDFVEVNGLRLTEPKQAYVRILQALTDKKLSPDQAQQLLNKRFSGNCKKSTIILVDELDYLCNRRQDVVYNILDWPSKRGSGLVVLTISNTMDLPERTLKGRVTSRMGLTRVTFQPYSHHQLRTIVQDRLSGTDTFHPDAVQLVARKVAAVSGDARRALDICRRTTELVTHGEQVTVSHVEQALTQIFSGPRVAVIQSLCREGQLMLRAIRDVNQRTGVDEATAAQVYQHLLEICLVEGCLRPSVSAALETCNSLVALGLVVAEKGRKDITRKMSLNVSSDDIHYALDRIKV